MRAPTQLQQPPNQIAASAISCPSEATTSRKGLPSELTAIDRSRRPIRSLDVETLNSEAAADGIQPVQDGMGAGLVGLD